MRSFNRRSVGGTLGRHERYGKVQAAFQEGDAMVWGRPVYDARRRWRLTVVDVPWPNPVSLRGRLPIGIGVINAYKNAGTPYAKKTTTGAWIRLCGRMLLLFRQPRDPSPLRWERIGRSPL